MDTIRCFLAVPLSEEVKKALQAMQSKLAGVLRPPDAKIGWVRPEGLHITLNFFGDIEPSLVESIAVATEKTVALQTCFHLDFRGLGAFPNLGRPRVLWTGLTFAPGLLELHERLGRHFSEAGLPWENKPLKPHVTLGRVRMEKRRGSIAEAMKKDLRQNFGSCEVRRIVLYRSHLQPGGSVYEELTSFSMQTNS